MKELGGANMDILANLIYLGIGGLILYWIIRIAVKHALRDSKRNF
jgi:hypothetical protein